MTDYWKSQSKKFCDFCKCWIADNKPSIGFHESGKRHKENVAKRLAEISKTSAKSFQDSLQVDKEMKKMEEEALKAYMKDLQENPDYTSQKLLEEAEKRKKELEETVRKQKEPIDKVEITEAENKSTSESSSTKVWYEAKSDEGHTYYWNINTAESRWEPPDEGFVSLEEQEKAKSKDEIKKKKKEKKAKRKQETSMSKESVEKKQKVENEEESITPMGPIPKPDPYGAWTVVEPKVEEPIDLELPHQDYIAIKVPDLKEPEVRFKEKTIASLDKDPLLENIVKKEEEVHTEGFKKRKFNKGNMRQKLDTY